MRCREVLDAEHLAAEDDALHLIAASADGGMRDGLSMLDQVLSFGEGPVTAARVREVLGLIPDDLYSEMLRLIAERDAAAVFPLVDRLVEAGADLGEFVSGAGATLRALLLVGVGGQPEGVTEGMQRVLRQHGARLPPPDIVRLLTVLGESEERIRRSGNTRLAVEVLLLRWAMADRTVAIGEVLEALKGGGQTAGRPVGRDSDPPVLRDTRPAEPHSPAARPPVRPSGPVDKGPLTLDHLRAVWPQIVADARTKTPLLGSLLAEAQVAAVEGTAVTLRPGNAGHAEGLERQRELIAQLIGRFVTEPPRVTVAAGERPLRLTAERANAERLNALRAKDAGLNAAVDALDLELLE